jgi:hypothetical protein
MLRLDPSIYFFKMYPRVKREDDIYYFFSPEK